MKVCDINFNSIPHWFCVLTYMIFFFNFLFIYFRDEISLRSSPLYENSDDSWYYDTSTNACSSQPECLPTSSVSPYRCQKSRFSLGPPGTSYPSQPRQRGSFPSSLIDICYSADLRRAALSRSVQMRAQPLGLSQFESPQEIGHHMEVEE